jgi:hypothetical protein
MTGYGRRRPGYGQLEAAATPRASRSYSIGGAAFLLPAAASREARAIRFARRPSTILHFSFAACCSAFVDKPIMAGFFSGRGRPGLLPVLGRAAHASARCFWRTCRGVPRRRVIFCPLNSVYCASVRLPGTYRLVGPPIALLTRLSHRSQVFTWNTAGCTLYTVRSNTQWTRSVRARFDFSLQATAACQLVSRARGSTCRYQYTWLSTAERRACVLGRRAGRPPLQAMVFTYARGTTRLDELFRDNLPKNSARRPVEIPCRSSDPACAVLA